MPSRLRWSLCGVLCQWCRSCVLLQASYLLNAAEHCFTYSVSFLRAGTGWNEVWLRDSRGAGVACGGHWQDSTRCRGPRSRLIATHA